MFNIADYDEQGNLSWWDWDLVKEVSQEHCIPMVPILGIGGLCKGVSQVAMGLKSRYGDFTAEGVVATPACRQLNHIRVKIKFRDFAGRLDLLEGL